MTKTMPPATSTTESALGGSSLSSGPLDVYKYRWLFLGISIAFLIPGIVALVMNMMNPQIGAPVRLGIDFKGGTLLEYGFYHKIKQDDIPAIQDIFDKHGYTGSIVQIQDAHHAVGTNGSDASSALPAVPVTTPEATPNNAKPKAISAAATPEKAVAEQKQVKPGSDTLKSESAKPVVSAPATSTPTPAVTTTQPAEVTPAETAGKAIANVVSIRSKQIHGQDDVLIRQQLEQKFGSITVLQKISMGPALAQELFTNGLLALGLAYLLIMGYLTFRFQFDFAVCAMAALLHDTVFLIGMFALLGMLFHTEVDSLFITAILTAIGFSVHDTIVVFDRIRENVRVHYTKKLSFVTIVNASVNQTLTRSINTSLTALLTMLALYVLGGETTRDFVLAIIIGIAAGTYSSIFNASVLLAMWRKRSEAATV